LHLATNFLDKQESTSMKELGNIQWLV